VIAKAVERMPAAGEALRAPRKITAGRTRILVSWPPSYHEVRGRFSEFPTYAEMTRHFFAWLQTLPGCDLTVSLHPAVSSAGRRAIEESGLAPDERYVIDLIPQHDIFVTYFSSTIRWAIACGKPVVNYDAYGLSLNVYDSAPGFVNARDFSHFQEALSRLVRVPGAFEELASRQSAIGETWGTLDGRCNERILAELDGLVRSRK
jgi:glycosyltransferase involved in cell wall biosynthesis